MQILSCESSCANRIGHKLTDQLLPLPLLFILFKNPIKFINHTIHHIQKSTPYARVLSHLKQVQIPEDKRGGAFHQDRVQVMLLPGRQGKRQEACVVQVLERGLKQVVGTWEQCENFGFVMSASCTVSGTRSA